MHFVTVHHFHRFAFLPVSKGLANGVSVDAALFRRSHSNRVLIFPISVNLRFGAVHHFHRFAFLTLSKRSVNGASVDAALFRPPHSNLVLTFGFSDNLHFPNVRHFHRGCAERFPVFHESLSKSTSAFFPLRPEPLEAFPM
jgi:hypothetical protein